MLRTSFHVRNKLKLEKGSLILQSIRKVYTKGHYESVRRFLLNFKQEVEYPSPTDLPRLTPRQVSSILNINQVSVEAGGPISNFEVNKLPANKPIEDRDAVARLKNYEKYKYLFGVYDGHGGYACSQALSERLFNYISASMSQQETLKEIAHENSDLDKIVDWFPYQPQYFDQDLDKLYKQSLAKFARESLANFEECSVEEHLRQAFIRLDHDIMSEGLPLAHSIGLNEQALGNGLSGSCACVAYVDETDLYVANTGDCKAVLGVQIDKDNWETVQLSNDHTGYNPSEVRRILNSHPNESSHIIKGGRLFGSLAPLRSFGDMMFKWSVKERDQLLRIFKHHPYFNVYSDILMNENYITPPYLTAEPEIKHQRLTPKDKFLVIASDGLWDMVPPDKVVKLIAGHMEGKEVLVSSVETHKLSLRDINENLKDRKNHLLNVPVDDNVTTHLIRNALGPEHGRLSAMLSLPEKVARNFRDDMTVIVVFFDCEYIRNFYVEHGEA